MSTAIPNLGSETSEIDYLLNVGYAFGYACEIVSITPDNYNVNEGDVVNVDVLVTGFCDGMGASPEILKTMRPRGDLSSNGVDQPANILFDRGPGTYSFSWNSQILNDANDDEEYIVRGEVNGIVVDSGAITVTNPDPIELESCMVR